MSKKKSKKLRHISLRVTQAEHDRLTKRAAGRTLSEYIRSEVFGRPGRVPLRPVEKVVLQRLGEIGDAICGSIEHVATHSTLKRGDVQTILRDVEEGLSEVQLYILKGGAEDGDC